MAIYAKQLNQYLITDSCLAKAKTTHDQKKVSKLLVKTAL